MSEGGRLDYPRVHAASRRALRAWLAKHHGRERGAWIVSYKKHTGRPRPDYGEIVEELLCFGWIDSRPASLDDERSMLLATPRKPGSRWSKLNKQRIARLTAAGKMAPAGLAAVDAARRSGTWSGLDEVEQLVVPRDLADALAARPPARSHFDGFPRGVRRNILEWISSARRPETRSKRIAETARLASRNVRAHQWRERGAGA